MMQMVYRHIRFTEKVDRCLRRGWRMRGDLSGRVRTALEKIDLASVSLLDVENRKTRATQIGQAEQGWVTVQLVADERGCSANTLVNSAVWAAYGVRKGTRAKNYSLEDAVPDVNNEPQPWATPQWRRSEDNSVLSSDAARLAGAKYDPENIEEIEKDMVESLTQDFKGCTHVDDVCLADA